MKYLHSAFTALGAVFLLSGVPLVGQAQSSRPAPIIDGASSLAEYGNQYTSPNNDDPNLAWRMTWDDTNLYVAIEDANLQQGAALYLDIDPQLPVNGTNGAQKGFDNYEKTNGNLPIQADIVIYAEKFYREFRIYNRQTRRWGAAQEWGKPGDADLSKRVGRYADNGGADGEKWNSEVPEQNYPGTVKEFSLPWALIGQLIDPANPTGGRRRPDNFNWFGQIHFSFDPLDRDNNIPNPDAGGIYGQVPRSNENSIRRNGANYVDYNWRHYFTVLNTAAGSDNRAFGPNGIASRPRPDGKVDVGVGIGSYSYSGPSETTVSFAGITFYDFTLNVPATTISRSTGNWTIQNNLVVGPSTTLNLGTSASAVSVGNDLIIDGTGVFNFQNTGASLQVGGDIAFTTATSFQNTAGVFLTGTADQTISAGTYRSLTVQGTGIKSITGNLTIEEVLTLTNGTLATGANRVTLANNATFTETGGYLLGNLAASTPATSPLTSAGGSYAFGGIGLTLTQRGNDFIGSANVLRITGGRGLLQGGPATNPNLTIARRFLIEATPTTGNLNRALDVTLALNYRIANPDELNRNNEGLLELYQTDNSNDPTTGPYQRVTGNGTTGRNTIAHTLTYQGPLRLDGTFFSLADGVTPLPVELVSFTGKAENGAARLSWTTASEQQNKGFEVERRTDQSEWQTLGFVAGHGTTNQRHSYAYLDRTPVAGNNYYRLRQLDADGKSVYSQPVTVQLGAIAFTLSPVPASAVLTLNGLGDGQHTAEIYNARGQRVLSQEFQGVAAATVTVSALPVGVYLVRVLGADRSVRTARFIKE
jgi:hypothetical protein